MSRSRLGKVVAGVVAILALAACGGRVPPPREGPGGLTPRESLQRFLQLAQDRRYLDMAWVFGTAKGAYINDVAAPVAERQMFLFSCLLRGHQREIVSEAPVPGSVGAAVEFVVRLRSGGETASVPFRAVRGPGDRWFVEQFRIEAITGSRLPVPQDCLSQLRAPSAR